MALIDRVYRCLQNSCLTFSRSTVFSEVLLIASDDLQLLLFKANFVNGSGQEKAEQAIFN